MTTTTTSVADRLARALKSSRKFNPILSTSTMNHQSPHFLKLYHPLHDLSGSDFQSLALSTTTPTPMSILKGRYTTNLKFTGNYLIQFDSESLLYDFQSKLNETMRPLDTHGKIDHVKITIFGKPTVISKVDNILQPHNWIYNSLPDLSDTKPILDRVADKEVVIRTRINTLAKHFKELQKTQSVGLDYVDEAIKMFKQILNNGWTGSVNRDQCVLVQNIPQNINLKNIRDLIWDFKLHYNATELDIRKVYVNKTTGASNYILILDSADSARAVVNRLHMQHVLFNESNPVMAAELL